MQIHLLGGTANHLRVLLHLLSKLLTVYVTQAAARNF
ncbi:unnamed protein product [Ixodes pacificus]